MKKSHLLIVSVIATFAIAGLAYAAQPCLQSLTYADAGPTPKNTNSSVLPSVGFDCGEIDDFRTYSITSVSGPGDLGESINSFNGRVSYNADTSGVYTVTVNVSWNCSCKTESRSDTFTVTIC